MRLNSRAFMNLVELQKELVAAARIHPPSDAVPDAFEKRAMARLSARPGQDNWSLWGVALWRSAAACVAISTLLTAWSFLPLHDNNPATVESTVLEAVEELSDTW